MSEGAFTASQRYAVFTVHGEKCYMCGAILTMTTFEIDHVIPKSLREKPKEFAKALADLGKPEDFDLDSYENWMPACRPCNGKKRRMVWEPSPLIQLVLQQAKAKAGEAKRVAGMLVEDQEAAEAINLLGRFVETREFTLHEKAKLLRLAEAQVTVRSPERADDPVRITPSYEIPLHEILHDDGRIKVAKGPYGIGGGPSGPDVSSGMRCGSCGAPYFNGVRCITCGAMDDGD